jgi:hypothetical protein
MIDGRITLRSGYLARVVFSPNDVVDGFRQKFLQGTIFDGKLKAGEADVLSKYRGSACQVVAMASRCQTCGTVVVMPEQFAARAGQVS